MESAQFSEALERVAVARRAMDNGYRSPLVYAGCVMGLFTLKDFRREPANRIPCAKDIENPRCTCPDEDEDEPDEENDQDTDESDSETAQNTKTNTNTTHDSHDKLCDIGANCAYHHGNTLSTKNSNVNGSHRKKVNFSIPEERTN